LRLRSQRHEPELIIKEGFDAGVRLAEAVPLDMIAIPLVHMHGMLWLGRQAISQKGHDPPRRPN
jgi:hypothetical protein